MFHLGAGSRQTEEERGQGRRTMCSFPKCPIKHVSGGWEGKGWLEMRVSCQVGSWVPSAQIWTKERPVRSWRWRHKFLHFWLGR